MEHAAFNFKLSLNHRYTLIFGSPGYAYKSIVIDTQNIPDENLAGEFSLEMDMSLLKRLPNLNYSVFDVPMGIAKYDPVYMTLRFDETYLDALWPLFQEFISKYELEIQKQANK